MKQCPYNEACHCTMEDPCPGCEEYEKSHARKLIELKVGDKVWVREGPYAKTKNRYDDDFYFIGEVTERNIILPNGRRFSRMLGEERGKSGEIWLVVPKPRWKAILLQNERTQQGKRKYPGD